ncbi:hypothetical protein BY996DRAFT_3892105 [Phakopsora pachyrhizi]|uniref:Uncharacterized protein n=1 Tax=Phakopsora pachyrhizi TaxID=170000 RepID=A0AAV0BDY6_PHAPC|nr:hypothetical protein BY996DRAFT_3892105 [Phakopsora pachyrhizi]CAH7684587.1 hypothetical protein PPACK8108_LOCUS18852 [Phakopsora pachyrhizi]
MRLPYPSCGAWGLAIMCNILCPAISLPPKMDPIQESLSAKSRALDSHTTYELGSAKLRSTQNTRTSLPRHPSGKTLREASTGQAIRIPRETSTAADSSEGEKSSLEHSARRSPAKWTKELLLRLKTWTKKAIQGFGMNFAQFWSRLGSEVSARPGYTCIRVASFLAWASIFVFWIPFFCT